MSNSIEINTKPISNLKEWTLGFLMFLLLGVAILAINFLQMCTLFVLPFSSQSFLRMNRFFANTWWGSIVHLMEGFRKIDVVFTGDRIPALEKAILISNHQQMADIPALFCFALRKGRLGDLKWFVKDAFKYIPGPGWGMLFLGNFFLKRNWLKDKGEIERVFSKTKKNNTPIWLVCFLEGTRITAKKLQRSQEYCSKENLKVLKNVLAPRTKGFEASVTSLRENVSAVYDVTIGFPEGIPTLTKLFCGAVTKIHLHVRRFPIETLPTSEAQIGEWAWNVWQEKDEILSYFHTHKKFPGPIVQDPLYQNL